MRRRSRRRGNRRKRRRQSRKTKKKTLKKFPSIEKSQNVLLTGLRVT